MQENFSHMNEQTMARRYPEGSVFASALKSGKKNGVGVYVFFGLLLAASGFGTVWGIMQTMSYSSAGESDMVGPGIAIVVFCALLVLLSVVLIVLTIKRSAIDVDGLMKKSAEHSKCSTSDLMEFERQAIAPDTCILALTGKAKAVLNGQKDGLLTRDYVYLADPKHMVLKRSDLAGVYFVVRTIYITVSNTRKPVNYLTLTLVSKQGAEVSAECSREAGEALMALLLEQNPELDTKDGTVIPEKDFGSYCKEKAFSRV